MATSPFEPSNPLWNVQKAAWGNSCRRGNLPPQRISCMTPEQISKYVHSQDFNRNSAIFTLFTIDKQSIEQIARQFNLNVDEVREIIKVYQEYLKYEERQ